MSNFILFMHLCMPSMSNVNLSNLTDSNSSYFFQRHDYWTVLYPLLRKLHPRKPREPRQ